MYCAHSRSPIRRRSARVSLGDYLAWRERSRTFEALGLSLGAPGDLSADGGEPPERIDGHLFDSGAVSALGVRPLLGRVFTDHDPRFGTPGSVIVISHRLWTERYGADPSIIGRQVRLNRSLVTVVGVMSPSFAYPDDRIEYWAPMWTLQPSVRRGTDPGTTDDVRLYNVVGRLRPGVTVEEAEADLVAITGGQWGVRVRPLREMLYGWATAPLATVQAAAALVLLMACANVAALLLARGTVRGPELALRMALGAGRGRIIRQLLTESALLSGIGGGLGLFVAWVSVRALRTLAPLPGQSAIPPVTIDARLLAITAALAVVTTVAFGVVPAFRSSRLKLVDSCKGLERGVIAGGQQRLRNALVVGQVAVAFVLLIAASLLTTSFARLVARDLHFDRDNLMTFDFRVSPTEFVRPAGSAGGVAQVHIGPLASVTLDRVLERLRTLPGVLSIAGISHHPTNTLVLAHVALTVDGRPAASAESNPPVYFLVTPDFFSTMRTPLVRGREFDERDTRSSPWVAVVNETLARTLWPGEDAIGKRIRLDVSSEEQTREVVGVVRDIPTRRAQLQADPVVYTSTRQQPATSRAPFAGIFGRMTFVLRSAGDPTTLMPAVRRAVAEVEPDRPLAECRVWARRPLFLGPALARVRAGGVCDRRHAHRGDRRLWRDELRRHPTPARDCGSHRARRRRPRRFAGVVSRQALAIVSVGLGIGLAGALGMSRFISSQLWGITPTDPATFLMVALIIGGAAAVACVLPLRRALRTDPVSVLRAE